MLVLRSLEKIVIFAGTLLIFFACVSAPSYSARGSSSHKKGVYHIVGKRQTLYRIAKVYKVDIKHLMKINGIKDPSKIKIGQKIFIPGATKRRYVPSYDEVLKGVARKGSYSFIWPVNGTLTRGFGFTGGRQHNGIDVAAPSGTSIKAAASGTVVHSDNTLKGYGNMIILSHSSGLSTVYAHNKRNLVKKGQVVKKGEVIALVGSTGASSGPHLHFEVRLRGNAVNPMDYLPVKP